MRDPEINAFAAPGGFVAANAGLITAMQTEDELAGVLAHEISHVQQQHILRAFEDTKKMSIPIMLGMLGVLIASSHRTDDAGAAAIMTGTSMIQQRQINFTRGEEAEADHVGIETLARAGFDPMAMAGAFQTLQKALLKQPGGDREMVDVLALVLQHDEQAVLAAVELALEAGVPTKMHVINLLHRLVDGKTVAPPPVTAPQALQLINEPEANVLRYDALREPDRKVSNAK